MLLPAYPWATRPTPLTADEVCSALVDAGGSLADAAARLKVGTLVLRKFCSSSTRAQATLGELRALQIDRAEKNLAGALADPDTRRQDWATRFALNSSNARDRGWSSDDSAATAARTSQPVLLLPVALWEDGTVLSPPAHHKQITLAANPPDPPAE